MSGRNSPSSFNPISFSRSSLDSLVFLPSGTSKMYLLLGVSDRRFPHGLRVRHFFFLVPFQQQFPLFASAHARRLVFLELAELVFLELAGLAFLEFARLQFLFEGFLARSPFFLGVVPRLGGQRRVEMHGVIALKEGKAALLEVVR